MNQIVYGIVSVGVLFTSMGAVASEDSQTEIETVVTGYSQDPSESKAHDQAVADCMKKLVEEKGKCEGNNGIYREVSCGVKCENKIDQWQCTATGSAFCHKQI